MEKMTQRDCIQMFNGLKAVVQPSFADIKDMEDKEEYMFHAKFIQAVSYNKKKLLPVIESIEEAEKISDDYKDYLKERDETLAKFAKKDKDGAPEKITTEIPGGVRTSYNVPDLAIKGSPAHKAIDALEKKHKAVIDARKKTEEEVKVMLKEEVKDLGLKLVRWSMIPKGLSQKAMDGVMFMIDETEEKEE